MSTNALFDLESLRIASPCSARWEDMQGDERLRYCNHCRKRVYNLSVLTRTEAAKLLQRTEGRLCARLYRRADGTVLTQDCPVGLAALTRKAAKWAFAAAATIVFLAQLVWQFGSSRQRPTIDGARAICSYYMRNPHPVFLLLKEREAQRPMDEDLKNTLSTLGYVDSSGG